MKKIILSGIVGALLFWSCGIIRSEEVHQKELPNMCPNPGFEEGKDVYPSGTWHRWGDNIWECAIYSPNEGRNGTACLKLTVKDTNYKTETYWSTQSIPYTGGRVIFSGWMKTEDIRKGKKEDAMAKIFLTTHGEDGKLIGYPIIVGLAEGTNDWKEYSTSFSPLPGTKSIRIHLVLANGATGTAWFDDFKLIYDTTDGKKESLIKNGEMEGPYTELKGEYGLIAPGWIVRDMMYEWGTWSADPVEPHNGKFSQKIESVAQTVRGIQQNVNIPLPKEKEYLLSLWHKGTVKGEVFLEGFNESGTPVTLIKEKIESSPGVWSQYQSKFRTTENYSAFILRISGFFPGTIWIDDVSMIEQP